MSMESKTASIGRGSRKRSRSSAHAIDFGSYIPAYLTYLAGKLSSGASAIYRPRFGVGITDWRIMALLAAEPWIGASQICNATGLDKAAVSRCVRSLQGLGLVDIAADRQDQRKQLIALTANGVALHDRIVELAVAREQALLSGLSSADRESLLRLLIHLQRRLPAANAVGTARKRSRLPHPR